MSTTNTSAAQAGLLERHHFLLRRLHSLSGIVPIGVFLCFHLFTNMQMAFGTFQHEVDWIHSQPALLFAEVFGIWLPIAFHAGLGIWYTFTGKANVKNYTYADNWRYALQRVTGIIALFFIFYHVATLRWRWDIFGLHTPFFTHAMTAEGQVIPFAHQATTIAVSSSLIFLWYVVGAFAVVYHFANGLWTAAISWGLTLSQAAQRRWLAVCVVVFLGLSGFATLSLIGAVAKPITDRERQAYEITKHIYSEQGYLFHKEDMIHPPASREVEGGLRELVMEAEAQANTAAGES